jgi:hypothetical protein
MNPALLIILVVFALGSLGALLFASLWRPLVALVLWIIVAQLLPRVCDILLTWGYYLGPFFTRQLGIKPASLVRLLGGLRKAGRPAHAALGTAIGFTISSLIVGWPSRYSFFLFVMLAGAAIFVLRGLLAYGLTVAHQVPTASDKPAPVIVDVQPVSVSHHEPLPLSSGSAETHVASSAQYPATTHQTIVCDSLDIQTSLTNLAKQYASSGRHQDAIQEFIRAYREGNKAAELFRHMSASYFAIGDHVNAELAAVEAARIEQAEQSRQVSQPIFGERTCRNCGRVSRAGRNRCKNCRTLLVYM